MLCRSQDLPQSSSCGRKGDSPSCYRQLLRCQVAKACWRIPFQWSGRPRRDGRICRAGDSETAGCQYPHLRHLPWPSTSWPCRGGQDHEDVSGPPWRSEEHTSELQSLMRISYAVFCLKKKKQKKKCILREQYT